MSLALVYGTASGHGRLWQAVERFAQSVDPGAAQIVDLHTNPVEWADGRPLASLATTTQESVRTIENASGVVLFAPVYRAAMPGVLKNFLDLLPLSSLEGKVVSVVAMGASPHHYLGIDHEVRRLASWFGAVVPATTGYLSGASFADGNLTNTAICELAQHAATVADMTRRLAGLAHLPRPLAALAG